MKIGIDARICSEKGYYSQFIKELIRELYTNNSEHTIVVYTQENLPFKRNSFFGDIQVNKVLKKENFGMMIFFDHQVPQGYSGNYILLLENLKEVFFPSKNFMKRKIYNYRLNKSIKKAEKVVVLDTSSAIELNEKLNIIDEKIHHIPGFFPQYNTPEEIHLKLDIKAKYNIRGDYFIYDSGNEAQNNFERILKTLVKLREKDFHMSLFVLCEDTAKDLDIRSRVIDYNLASQIFFIGNVPAGEEPYYYKQSSGVIFSSIYESFPFHFGKAIAYKCRIFANEIQANEHTMGESIHYLDPLSIHNMRDCIIEALQKNKSVSYAPVLKKFSPQNSVVALNSIIERKD